MRVLDVEHLGLTVDDEPVIEYEPDSSDGFHVVTLYRGHLRNYWHVDDVSAEVRAALVAEASR
jgi:hypothetical protein